MDLVKGNIGSEANYAVKFENKKLVAEVLYDGKVVDSGLVLKLDLEIVKEAIKKAIPGVVDDAILDIMFAQLLSK